MGTQFKTTDFTAARLGARAPAAAVGAIAQAIGAARPEVASQTLEEVAAAPQPLDLASWDAALAKAEAAIAARDTFDAAHLAALAAKHALSGLQPWDAANDSAWETYARLCKEATRATRDLAALTPPSERGLILVMRLLCDTEALDESGAGGEAIEAMGRHAAEILDGSAAREGFVGGALAQWQRLHTSVQESRAEFMHYTAQTYEPAADRFVEAKARLASGRPLNTDEAEVEAYRAIEDQHLRLCGNALEARKDLYRAASPGPAELATKLQLMVDEQDWELVDFPEFVGTFASDARRFARLGAPAQQDADLLGAFSFCRQKDAAWFTDAPGAREYDVAAERERERLEDLIYDTRAETLEGVVARLRVAFKHIVEYRFADHAMVDPRHPSFVAGLKEAGGNERLLWGAIEDLARIGGIDLAGGVSLGSATSRSAVPNGEAPSPRALLVERAQLREREAALLFGDDLSDEQFEAIGGELNRIERDIHQTPACSGDDAVAKLLLVAQLVLEGMEPDVAFAADAVAEARRFGLGEGASIPSELA